MPKSIAKLDIERTQERHDKWEQEERRNNNENTKMKKRETKRKKKTQGEERRDDTRSAFPQTAFMFRSTYFPCQVPHDREQFRSFHHISSLHGFPWYGSSEATTNAELLNAYHTGASVTTLCQKLESEPSPTASSLELGLVTKQSGTLSAIF